MAEGQGQRAAAEAKPAVGRDSAYHSIWRFPGIIIIIIIIPKRTAPRRVLSLGSLGRAAPSRPVARWARGRQPLRIVMINMFTMPYGLPCELPYGLPDGLPYGLPDGFVGMTTLYT